MGSGGGVKTPPYRRAEMERLPDKGRYLQGYPSSGPVGPPSPAGEGLGAGGAEPGPYGRTGICERYRLGNTYKALQYPYRFPLDVTCGMVYTIGIRTVLFYYILYQLIPDSVT